jgi:outer membrane murein-binding lipoprotein Lpp
MNNEERILSLLEIMNGRLENLEADVCSLKSGQARLEADVSGLKSDVSILKVGQAKLEADVQTIKEDVTIIKHDVGVVYREIDNYAWKNVYVDEKRVAALESFVDGLRALLAEKTSRV